MGMVTRQHRRVFAYAEAKIADSFRQIAQESAPKNCDRCKQSEAKLPKHQPRKHVISGNNRWKCPLSNTRVLALPINIHSQLSIPRLMAMGIAFSERQCDSFRDPSETDGIYCVSSASPFVNARLRNHYGT